jgi:hypothetical protein
VKCRRCTRCFVTALETFCLSRQAEKINEDLRVLSDGLDDVPPLSLDSGNEGADVRKVGGSVQATEAAGDFLFDLHHASIAFGLIVGEGHGRIVEKAQSVLLAGCVALVSGSARLATTTLREQILVEFITRRI